jgi:outer membrane receptor protein involved in Fe transport
VYTLRDDFTFSYDAGGRHDLRVGGEYLHLLDDTRNCRYCGGNIVATGGPRPANIEALFPDAFNADTWNLAAISSITTQYTLGVSDSSAFLTLGHLWKYGAWAQDDWKMSRLTLNLGVRYDLIWNALRPERHFPAVLAGRATAGREEYPAASRLCVPAR